MVRLTLIYRLSDAQPLAESLESTRDPEVEQFKSQAKTIIKRLSQQSSSQASKTSVEAGRFTFHYIVDGNVVFLTLAEKAYPKQLAHQYLEELAGEFGRLYGSQVESVHYPYAFIKFDTFIQKTKKLYMDTRTQRNLARINDDLKEVHNIMTKNIQEVLGQGEKLDSMSQLSATMRQETQAYATRAKDLHRQALIRKYMPLVVVGFVVLAVLWIRSKLYK